jgi:HEAT repeat protein
MRLIGAAASLLICCTAIAIPRVHAQAQSHVAKLLEQLQSPDSSNRAAQELLKLGRSTPDARFYLVAHLPPLIEKGPNDSPQPWRNAVCLAADLKLAEASPALAKWIGLNTGGTVTFAEEARLEHNPAAKALVQIGEPAVSSLAGVLSKGNLGERQAAVYALKLIGSSHARAVLREHLRREADTSLRDLIERALGKG